MNKETFEINKAIGFRIKKARISKGLTQSEFAKVIGYSDKAVICRIEKGLVELTQTKICQFADALGVDAAFLLVGDAEPVRIAFTDDKHSLIIEKYDALNDKQKERLLAYADFLRLESK